MGIGLGASSSARRHASNLATFAQHFIVGGVVWVLGGVGARSGRHFKGARQTGKWGNAIDEDGDGELGWEARRSPHVLATNHPSTTRVYF
jgi:hypothetical protein